MIPCKWCRGTGQSVTDHPKFGPEVSECPDCDGSGERPDPCPTCRGVETINPLTAPADVLCMLIEQCPTCEGTGEAP